MDFGISAAVGAFTFIGVVGGLAFFGYNIHRILTMLPAILGLALFVAAVPLTVSVITNQKTNYVSNANPQSIEITNVENTRVDDGRIKVIVTLSAPGRVLLKYTGPGRDFIIPITPEGGSTPRTIQTFYIAKDVKTPGTVTFDVEGEERLYRGTPLIVN